MRRNSLVTLVLVAAALLPGLMMPAQGQVPRADLEVTGLEIVGALYSGAEPATVFATVRNNGPDSTGVPGGIVHFRYGSQPLTGDTRSDQPFNVTQPLAAGQTVVVRVAWTPTAAQRGSGTVTATVESSWDRTPSSNDRLSGPVFVRDASTRLRAVDDEPRSTFPGRTAFFRVNLTNTGNENTTYAATLARQPAGDDPGPGDWKLPEGWAGRVEPANITIPPGASATLVALLTSPASAADGTVVKARMNVTPDVAVADPPAQVLPDVTVTDELPPDFVRGLTIEPVHESGHLEAGADLAAIQWSITNLGTEPDAFSFEVSVEGTIAHLVETVPPTVVALNASEGTTVLLRARVDESARKGEPGTLVLRAVSINAAPEDLAQEARFDFRVSGPVLVIEDVSAPDPVYQDQGVVPITVHVRNIGDRPSTEGDVSVLAVRAGFIVGSATARHPRIAPATSVPVAVALGTDTLQGAYGLSAFLGANSTSDAINSSAREPLGNLVVRTAAVRVRPASSLLLEPGDYARFVHPPYLFEVQNQGNARELFTVAVSTPGGWINFTRQLSIDPGSRAGVPIEFWVPDRPGVALEVVRVSASLVNRSHVTSDNATTVLIRDEDPPRLVRLDAPGSVEALSAFLVEGVFEDAVGVSKAWMTVTAPDGAQSSTTLERVEGDEFAAELRFDQVGTYQLLVHAEDRADRSNAFTAREPREVISVFDRRPTLALLEPTSGALRSGGAIRLLVDDIAGLAELNVTVRGQEFPLRGDKSIDTTGWLEGVFPIHVRAVNRFGIENETDFNVTIDNTPPIVTSLRVDPSKPRPGDTITITAEVGGDPFEVRARLASEGQTPIWVPMFRRGSTYTGTVPLVDGTYVLTVEAEDAAGNVGTPDGPLTLQVASRTSFLGVVGIIALLTVVAALRKAGGGRRL